MASDISRRKFLSTGAKAAIGLTIIPSTVLGKNFGHIAPSDKLNIAAVGIGGMGPVSYTHLDVYKRQSNRI